MGKQIWRRRRLLKRKEASDILKKDFEVGRASGSKRATFVDTTALFWDKDPTEDLATYYRGLLQCQEGGQSRGQSCGRLLAKLLDSWKRRERERGKRNFNRSSTESNNILKKRENSASTGSQQKFWKICGKKKKTLAEILNER